MKRKTGFVFFASAGAWFLTALCCQARNLEVNIDYGSIRPARTVTVNVEQGDTALIALMKAAETATHPAGEHVFVVAVDGVEGRRGDMAWYYTLDGRPAKQLAFRQALDEEVKSMAWNYTPDVCSGKADRAGKK